MSVFASFFRRMRFSPAADYRRRRRAAAAAAAATPLPMMPLLPFSFLRHRLSPIFTLMVFLRLLADAFACRYGLLAPIFDADIRFRHFRC